MNSITMTYIIYSKKRRWFFWIMDKLAFMEHLLQNVMSPSNITNYITEIRSMYIVYGLDTTEFSDKRISFIPESCKN